MSISIDVSAPGAIPDLTTLISTVADWLDRDDITDKVPVFIQMAEAAFNRTLRSSEMEQSVLFTGSSEDTPLPDDYLAMRSLYEEGSPDRPLRAMSPSAIREEFSGISGCPTAYCLVGQAIRLLPPPSNPVLLAMDYWGKIQPLSLYTPSNWVLMEHPDAYLYGTLFYAEAYLDNSTRAGQWKSLVDGIVDNINRSSTADRFGAGALVPNTVVQVRGAVC